MTKKAASTSAPTVKPLASGSAKSKAELIKKPAGALLAIPANSGDAAASKPAKPTKAIAKPVSKEPAVKEAAAKPEDKEKPKKPKLVRDSFTMPEAEYAVLGQVKKDFLKAGFEVKKSELLRVGVALIRQLDTTKLKEVLDTLPALKSGRPKKAK
ncbi:hypothetical protein RY831_23410 [Noviherbaspirillum sp. CPCC 100848]|uniref:Uncharacterized protein n=1 Tax=Noviherbaspirillum album TaxID=3080276 RepID=A0ABU6JEP3_9BURK|nr:hypothetical protein [Noviherbaspirillum sp. CPCC 100848]MEC4722119.1 hypothetical protein [Noviherbaspirillum sp. CPCC 100848]